MVRINRSKIILPTINILAASGSTRNDPNPVSVPSSTPVAVTVTGVEKVKLADEVNVRGSLTLLKTKARVRRRTAAEIEAADEHSPLTENDTGIHFRQFSNGDESDMYAARNREAGNAKPPAHPTAYSSSSSSSNNNNNINSSNNNHSNNSSSSSSSSSSNRNGRNPLSNDISKPVDPTPPLRRFDSRQDPKSSSQTDNWDDLEGAEIDFSESHSMLTCPSCGRHFNKEPFAKHVKVCKKVFVQKRKVFDSSSMRLKAIPDLQSVQPSAASNRKKNLSNSKPQQMNPNGTKIWKQQSESFREAIRAARELKEYEEMRQEAVLLGTAQHLPPPPLPRPSAPDPSLIQCPHCERRFNSKAAERHIPQCQNIFAKPSTLKKGSGVGLLAAPASSSKQGLKKNRGWQ